MAAPIVRPGNRSDGDDCRAALGHGGIICRSQTRSSLLWKTLSRLVLDLVQWPVVGFTAAFAIANVDAPPFGDGACRPAPATSFSIHCGLRKRLEALLLELGAHRLQASPSGWTPRPAAGQRQPGHDFANAARGARDEALRSNNV
jgi:hypothetical protein